MAPPHLAWLALFSLTLLATAYVTPDGNSYDHKSNARVVEKSLTITWENAAPNGAPRKIIKTNGKFPAPALIFDEDDNVKVCRTETAASNFHFAFVSLDKELRPDSLGVCLRGFRSQSITACRLTLQSIGMA
jgi:hypothetical protein